MIIMLVLFTAVNLINHKNLKLDRKDLITIILSGLTGTLLFQLFTIIGVQYVGPLVTALLTSLSTAISLLIEYAFFHRKKTLLGILAALISIIGVYFIAGYNLGGLTASALIGYGISLLAVISWVVYGFLSNKVSKKYEQTVVLNYQAIVGVVTMLPFLFIYQPLSVSIIFESDVIINLIILGVFNSSLSYFFGVYAFKHVGVTLSNIVLNCTGIVTMVVSIILYNAWPAIGQIIGGLLLIVSVIILDLDEKKLKKPRQNPDSEAPATQ
jgi:drug/metabolite transporter (DMT)-like permease